MGGNQEKKYNRISKRVLRCFLPALLILALIVPVLLAVPVSADSFISWDQIGIEMWTSEYVSSYSNYYSIADSITFSNDSSTGRGLGFYVTPGNDVSENYIRFPVGDFSDLVITGSLDISKGGASSWSRRTSSGTPAFLLSVGCYDFSGSFIGYVKKWILTPTTFEEGLLTISILGAELYSSTSFFTVQSYWCGLSDKAFNDSANNGSNHYGDLLLPLYTVTGGFSITTSDGSWTSDSFTEKGAETPKFSWSHETQTTYLGSGDKVHMYVGASGLGDVPLTVKFIYADVGYEIETLDYDSEHGVHYAAFNWNYSKYNYAAYWVTVHFILNDVVIHTTETAFFYTSDYDDSGGSGGSGDSSEVTEMITQLETDVQEVMDAVEINSAKIDTLTEEVEQLPGEIKDSMAELQEEEKNQAFSEGDEGAQQVIEIVPDPSADFIPAFQNLVSVMQYEGTAAVLTLPAVAIPAIPGVIPEIHLVDSQDLDFEYYINLIPDLFLTIIQALFDAALVLFCLKELFDLIQQVFTGFVSKFKNE